MEEQIPDDKHSVKTFVKETERSGAYAFLVNELGTKEGISNTMAARIKKGVRDNVKLFHPEQQQHYQQQRPRNRGPEMVVLVVVAHIMRTNVHLVILPQ